MPDTPMRDAVPPSRVAETLFPTEQINPRTRDIDLLPTEGILRAINGEDAEIAAAVARAIPQIAVVVDRIADGLERGGRLFYFGAGTSGRLGILDAAECPPTYGTDPLLVQAFIAGGDTALRRAVEGAEDSEEMGVRDAEAVGPKPEDVVVGLSASGGAAYVLGAVRAARRAGCFTAGLTCNPHGALNGEVDQAMVVEVGPEAIAGSTRMKAGTAQKLVLNMLSTAAMVKIGKTYENWMVDVQPTNEKLRRRARRMAAALAGVSEPEAERALTETDYRVKPAVLMLSLGIPREAAERRLAETAGRLRPALIKNS